MSATTDNLNKRTRELENDEVKRGEELVRTQQLQNHVQALNDERVKNLALEKQENMAQNQILETMSTAGAMAAGVGSESSGGGAVVSPQTQATLGKYGLVGQPRIARTSHRDVQVKPNNIVINNTTNNTTTNNITGGGPIQGRPVSILPQGPSPEAKSQGRFKAWMENMFAQQKGANEKRAREYEKREWSLTKSINKMIRRMEDTARATAKALDPRGIGQTVSSQIKTLFFLFGIHFLAKNWDKILDVGAKIFGGIKDFVSWLGIGPEGKKRRANGTDIRGTLIWFLTGDESKARNKKVSLLSILTDIFDAFRDHLKTWFEKQMALRGAAIKNVKFPDLKLGENSSGWGLDAMFGRLVSALGSTLGKVMSGVTTYLGDILTALVNPEAGAARNVDRGIERQANISSEMARQREGMNMFRSVGDNTMRGDYALEARNDQGKKSYALMNNALDTNGQLTGSASSQISQSRDILGAYNDTKNYGAVDISRVYTGLQRLRDSANKEGGVYLDEEFVNRMFNPNDIKNAGLTKVPMKYVRVANDANYMNMQHQYMMSDTGWGTAGDVAAVAGEVGGLVIPGVGTLKAAKALSTAGKLTAAKAAGKTLTYGAKAAITSGLLGSAAKGVVGWAAGFAEDDNHLELVPADDPRPSATVDGKPTRIVTYYKAKPEAIQSLISKFDPENKGDKELIIGNIEKHMINSAGGKANVDRQWNTRGKKSGYFERQNVTDVDSQLKEYRNIHNLTKYYDNKLENDKLSRYTDAWSNNTKYLANKAIGLVNSGIDWAANTYMDMTSAKNATFSYDKRPERPVDNGSQFNPVNAVAALHSNASPQPTGYCAREVRKAIAAGLGIPDTTQVTGTIKSAADYSGSLGKLGFAPLNWNRYSPQVGDVLVEPRLPGHPHGHIAMFDGTRWVSDFPQRDMWGGTTFRHYKKGVVFRHLSMGGGDESALSVENDTQQAQDDAFYSYGSYIGGTTQFTASGNIGGIPASFSGSMTPPSISTSKDRGDWFNQHRNKWYNFLGSRGYSEADSSRLSTFFAAQDGFESGGPNTKYAWDNHNWGGMKYKKKLLSFDSDEAYMEAKLKMMNGKFKNSLGARDLGEYIRAIHNPDINNGFAYNVAKGFNAETGEGFDKQMQEADRYIAGAMSYAQSGLQYSGSNSSLNPLVAQAKDGADMEYDAPDIPTFGGVLSEEQMKARQNEMKFREEGADLWRMASDSGLTLMDPTRTYALSAEEFIDDYAKGRLSRSGTKRMITKHHEGKMLYNSTNDSVRKKVLGEKDAKTFIREYRSMSNEEQEGVRQKIKRVEEGEARFEDWLKNYFQKLPRDKQRTLASYLGAMGSFGTIDDDLLKEAYGDVLVGNFKGYEKPGDEDFMASVLYGSSYYNGSEVKKKSLRSNVGTINQYMNENSFRKTGNAANSKVSQIMKLQEDIANIEEQKVALEAKYNKIFRDAGNTLTHEQYIALSDQYIKEYEDLLKNQDILQGDIDKIVEQAKKNEKEYLERAAKQAQLIRTSKENLESEFSKLLNKNVSFIDAINDMVNKYGEGVLEKLYGVKGLRKSDFLIEDFEKAMEEAKKSDEKLKEQYGDNIPMVIVSAQDQVLESAWKIKAAAESQQGKKQGMSDRGAGKVISSSMSTFNWKASTGEQPNNVRNLINPYGIANKEGTTYSGTNVKVPYATSMSISNKKGKAEGGWIPGGPVNTPYHYSEGGEVTVHAGEYVVPKYMTQMPEVRRDVDKWERYRISTVAGQKIGDSKMKEPENYSEQMLTRQIQTNDLLELLIRSNAEGLSEVAQITAKTIPTSSQPSGPIKPMNKFSYK